MTRSSLQLTADSPGEVDGPREEVLININSKLFGGSGALRVGDYKIIVNANPEESKIYSKVAQGGTA